MLLVFQKYEPKQELLTLPQDLNSPQAFIGIRVTRSLVLYVCFVDRCLSFCTFSFGHCKTRLKRCNCLVGAHLQTCLIDNALTSTTLTRQETTMTISY
jgi:hypothetical protein